MTIDKKSQIEDDAAFDGQIIEAGKNDLAPVSSGDSLSKYLNQINKFPILTAEEEYKYAVRLKENGDKEAAQILVQSHLRLVAKMAGKYRSYGLPITDLISEGNVGLVKAVKKFDPHKGFRFSTYAMWWIKANMQEYILRSWSLVKIGTTKAQKKLFFNLRKVKRRLGLDSEMKSLSNDEIKKISSSLGVKESEVQDMDVRMTGADISLNSTSGGDSLDEFGDSIESKEDSQEEIAINRQDKYRKEELLKEAFMILNERERDILVKRQMSEIMSTLDDLSKTYKISKERIRQIEVGAMEKIKKEILRLQSI